MLATAMSTFLASAMDYFSMSIDLVSVELVLASLSAVVYFMFSSRRIRRKGETNASSDIAFLKGVAGHASVPTLNAKRISSIQGSPRTTYAGSDGNTSIQSSPRSSSTSDDLAHCVAAKDAARMCKWTTMRSNDIRSCGRNGNLNGALKVFEKLGEEADNTLVLNSMLDACVECQDLEKAFYYFNRARDLEHADVVTYNRMMKGYLAQGQEPAAMDLLKELTLKRMANATSYHFLLNFRVNAGNMRGAWRIVADMQSDGTAPNAVTCAILLKGKLLLKVEEVSRVLTLVEAMEDTMDEVLFMAVAEACVRVGRLDMLSRQMEKFKRQGASGGLSAETYGSMIKAYGRARDTGRVWELWGQMASDSTRLTSVTLGCMVEALVANGQSTEAWQLVQKLLKDDNARPLVNTVICSSILKGFAYTKDTDKVMALYKEMQSYSIQPNTITFNTILNAFAQCGTMQYAPQLLEDMRATKPAVEPDIVTYSTLVKGYCYAGSLDRALQVFTEMQKEGKCVPDEVLFNSLLGGCAKEFRLDDALQLLSDMRKTGVAPSNYTLSMLVKLMCRCRRLEQAFTMLEDISKEYKFQINIQVYTCLIQGCFHNGQADKALAVYDKIIVEKLNPDAMTYAALVRGCLRAGSTGKAADLVRRAHGVGVEASKGQPAAPGVNAACLDEVVAALGGAEGAALLADVHASSRRSGQWQGH